MMQPLNVQVIAYAPTAFRHCQHCEVAFSTLGLGEAIHRFEARDALPNDLLIDFQRVSDWVHRLLQRHPSGVRVSVVDAASIEGVWSSFRHHVRRYPAVVVDGAAHWLGPDPKDLDGVIDKHVRAGRPASEEVMPGV
jgi:hypothetical protein